VASALVDVERRAQFEEEGAHYESNYFLTFLYLPPPEDTARGKGFSTMDAIAGKTRMLGKCNVASSIVPTACLACRRLYARTQMDR